MDALALVLGRSWHGLARLKRSRLHHAGAQRPGEEPRMSKRFHFIDSDAHVLEPRDMFERYLEPQYRAQMPVAWANYQGEPLAFGFEIRVPKPAGGAYVMPFGNDPLTGRNRIDAHARCAAAAVDLRDTEEAAREARRCVKDFDFKAVYINPVPVGEHRLYDDFYEPL